MVKRREEEEDPITSPGTAYLVGQVKQCCGCSQRCTLQYCVDCLSIVWAPTPRTAQVASQVVRLHSARCGCAASVLCTQGAACMRARLASSHPACHSPVACHAMSPYNFSC